MPSRSRTRVHLRLSALLLLVLIATPLASAWAAPVRIKIVTVYSDDPNDPFAQTVSLIKVVIGTESGITGDNEEGTEKCVGGANNRLPCSGPADCPGSGLCFDPGDNDLDGDDDGFGIARITVPSGFHTISIPTEELRDFDGNKYRVGSMRIEKTVTAEGKLCRPATTPEGKVGFLFDENVDHSSASDYTVAIRIVPLSAPPVQSAVACGGGAAAAKAINKCKGAVVKAGSDFFETRLRALAKCEDRKHAGKLAKNIDCRTETTTRATLIKARATLDKTLGKACGGGDKICGGDTANELAAAAGFGPTCPGFRGACKNAIADCSGVADCLACVNAAAGDAYMERFASIGFADPEDQAQLNKCQRSVIDAGVDLAVVQANLQQRCWEGLLAKPVPSHPGCKGPLQENLFNRLLKNRAKLSKAVCKACGGKEEKGCGGSDDFPLAQIGFATCPVNVVSFVRPDDVVQCLFLVAGQENACRGPVGAPSLDTPGSECAGGLVH